LGIDTVSVQADRKIISRYQARKANVFRAHQGSTKCGIGSKEDASNSRKENAMKPMLDGSLHRSGYGAPELRQYYQKYMSRSLMLSIVLQIACVTSYYFFQAPEGRIEPPRIAEVISYRSLIPPSLFQRSLSSSTSTGTKSVVRPRYAIPIPAVDPLVDSNNTIPSQRQLGEPSGTYSEFTIVGDGADHAINPEDDNVEPSPFRAIEKTPQVVKRVGPRYPESAIRAGIEGSVILNMWVDRTGKVRKAVVIKSDADILNTSAIEAAMQWVFTPAIMQHGPVSVWVSIPFRFKLRGN
jgi:TonB family protein